MTTIFIIFPLTAKKEKKAKAVEVIRLAFFTHIIFLLIDKINNSKLYGNHSDE